MDVKDCKTIDDYLKMMNRSSVYELTDEELNDWFAVTFGVVPWVRPNYGQLRPLIDGHSDISMECHVDGFPGEAEAMGMVPPKDYYLLRVDGSEYKIDVIDLEE